MPGKTVRLIFFVEPFHLNPIFLAEHGSKLACGGFGGKDYAEINFARILQGISRTPELPQNFAVISPRKLFAVSFHRFSIGWRPCRLHAPGLGSAGLDLFCNDDWLLSEDERIFAGLKAYGL
jgi:hypothetical protein